MSDKVRENYLRRQAARLGHVIEKSRGRKWSVNDRLGWRVLDQGGQIVGGEKYELTIDDVEGILNGIEARVR